MELYTGQLKKYQFNIKTTRGSTHKKDGNKSYKKSKCYDIFTFDLENTNAWILPDGSVIPYHKGETEEYWNDLQATSLVYIWQFGVNDTVYYGRDLWDFLQLLDDLPNAELQIFIHNLSHEFCFLRSILTPDNVFARSPHKPMKCTFTEYPLYTFRCSYIMTNLSLENWGKQIGIEKKTGQLDYDSKLRTPYTELSELEKEYCEFDILVMYYGIKKEIARYGDVFSIPLTSTGKVRKAVKELLFEDKSYNRWIKSLVPDINEYRLLLKAFQGGYCHCNKIHANKIIDSMYLNMIGDLNENVISHWDFTSSYPTVLLSEKYPYTKFYKRDRHDIVTNSTTRDKYAFIYHLKFTNLRSINPNSYISISKSEHTGTITKDNGRVINCYGELWYTCTDADFDIISWLYEWDKLEVIESWYSRKEYLPKPFLDYILTLYADKTELKGVSDKSDFYMQQKAYLNSLYPKRNVCYCFNT